MTALTTHRGFAPATITEAMEFSKMLSESSMVPKAYQGKPQDIMVCVQWGYEIGLAPMQALQNIAVINGKPSVYGDAAMALVQASPVCEGVDEYIDAEGTANPVAVCVAKRKGRSPVTAKFSVEDAKRAGLWGKQGPWQAYPKRMLQMRARGFALRDAFPDVLKGLITAEEAQDFPVEQAPIKDITPRNPLDAIAPPATMEEVVDEVDQLRKELEDAGIEIVEIPEVVEAIEERAAIIAESGTPHDQALQEAVEQHGYALMLPGSDVPKERFIDLGDWLKAYDQLADRTAKAGKAEPRLRMTKLRELRDANSKILAQLSPILESVVTANYQRRLKTLGAQLEPQES